MLPVKELAISIIRNEDYKTETGLKKAINFGLTPVATIDANSLSRIILPLVMNLLYHSVISSDVSFSIPEIRTKLSTFTHRRFLDVTTYYYARGLTTDIGTELFNGFELALQEINWKQLISFADYAGRQSFFSDLIVEKRTTLFSTLDINYLSDETNSFYINKLKEIDELKQLCNELKGFHIRYGLQYNEANFISYFRGLRYMPTIEILSGTSIGKYLKDLMKQQLLLDSLEITNDNIITPTEPFSTEVFISCNTDTVHLCNQFSSQAIIIPKDIERLDEQSKREINFACEIVSATKLSHLAMLPLAIRKPHSCIHSLLPKPKALIPDTTTTLAEHLPTFKSSFTNGTKEWQEIATAIHQYIFNLSFLYDKRVYNELFEYRLLLSKLIDEHKIQIKAN